jgi:hypothetical protein
VRPAAAIARLKPKLAQVQGIALFMQVRQDIQVGGRPSKTQYQYTLQDGNSDELARWAPDPCLQPSLNGARPVVRPRPAALPHKTEAYRHLSRELLVRVALGGLRPEPQRHGVPAIQ